MNTSGRYQKKSVPGRELNEHLQFFGMGRNRLAFGRSKGLFAP